MTAPTLVVVCAHDQRDFRALAERVAAEVRGAERIVVPTAHLPGVERPDELGRAVLSFLETTDA